MSTRDSWEDGIRDFWSCGGIITEPSIPRGALPDPLMYALDLWRDTDLDSPDGIADVANDLHNALQDVLMHVGAL